MTASGLPVGGMVVVGAGVFTITALAFFRVPILPAIGDDLSMSTTQLGLLTTTYAVGRLSMDVPAGTMADRLPAASLLRMAAWLVAAGSALMAMAPTAALAYVAIFVLGTGTALANTTGATYFSTRAPVARRGMAVSSYAAAQLGGQAFGPAASGGLAAAWSWRTSEGIAAGIAVALVVAVTLRGTRSTAVLSGEGHGGTSAPAAIPARLLVVLFAVPFVMFLTIGAMIQTLVPVIADDELGLSAAVIGLAAGLGGLCRFAGAVVAGRVADRVSRKAALVPGLVLQTTGVALLAAAASGPGVWLAAIVLLSLGSVATAIAIAVLADLAPRESLGGILGRFRFAGDLGLIIGPVATARLYDSFGAPAAVLPVAALGAVCAIAVATLVPETRWR